MSVAIFCVFFGFGALTAKFFGSRGQEVYAPSDVLRRPDFNRVEQNAVVSQEPTAAITDEQIDYESDAREILMDDIRGLSKLRELDPVLFKWCQSDLAGALRWMVELQRNDVAEYCWEQIAMLAPEAGFEALDALDEGRIRQHAIEGLAMGLSSYSEPEEMIATLFPKLSQIERDTFIEEMAGMYISYTNPLLIKDLANHMSDGAKKDNIIGRGIFDLARIDSKQSATWLNQLASEETDLMRRLDRRGVTASFWNDWVRGDWKSADGFARRQDASPLVREGIVRAISKSLMEKSEEDHARWLQTLPGESRELLEEVK